MNRDKILNRIKSLVERTQHNGFTEAEALQATSKVGELMNKYDISMNDVEFGNEEFDKFEIKLNSKRTNFMAHVMSAIGVFTDTKVWMGRWSDDKSTKNRKYCFFGTKKDMLIAEYIYDLIENSINLELKKFKKSDLYKQSPSGARTKNANFISGITNRLHKRLIEMKEEISASNKQTYSTSVGLVEYDKFEIVENKFRETLDIKLKQNHSSRTIRDKSAYLSGVSAGDNININSAVTSANKSGQKFIS